MGTVRHKLQPVKCCTILRSGNAIKRLGDFQVQKVERK